MTENSDATYQEVTKKATKGMGWNYLSFGFGKALNLLTISILAHLLAPEYFGLVTLATVITDYIAVINDMGLGAALIQRRQKIEEAASIAFILNIGAGIILTTIIFFVAPYAAVIFKEPEVTQVTQWLGLSFLITAFGSTHNVLLQREMNFRKKIVPELGNTVIKAIVSISLALAGFGVWALVAGQLVGVLTSSILLWVVEPWRPKLFWDGETDKGLFKYGVSIMGNNVLSSWEDSFDYLVIGLIYNPAALGIYTLGYRLPQTLVLNILWVMTAVLFPAFSSLQNDIAALKKSFLSTMRYVELFVTPICLGMIIAADPLIRVAFGEQWLDTIPILQVLSLYVWVVSIGFHVGDVYKAIGRPDILVTTSIPMFIVRIFLLWIGAQYSLVGVGIAHLVAGILSAIIRYYVAAYFLKLSFIEVIKELTAFICGIGLIICTIPAYYFTIGNTPLIRLILITISGAIGYLTIAWFIERDSINYALQLIGIKKDTISPEKKTI